MIPLLTFCLVDVVDSRWKGKHNMIQVYLFLLVELEFGEWQAEEQHLLLAGNPCDVL